MTDIKLLGIFKHSISENGSINTITQTRIKCIPDADMLEYIRKIGISITISTLFKSSTMVLPLNWFHFKKDDKYSFIIDDKGRLRFSIDTAGKFISALRRYEYTIEVNKNTSDIYPIIRATVFDGGKISQDRIFRDNVSKEIFMECGRDVEKTKRKAYEMFGQEMQEVYPDWENIYTYWD